MLDRNNVLIFLVSQIPLHSALLLIIVLFDAWLRDVDITVREIPPLLAVAFITVSVLLLLIQTPVHYGLRTRSFWPATAAGIATGIGFASLIDYWVTSQDGMILCRRPVLYFAFFAISAIFSFRLQHLFRLPRLVNP